MRENYDCYDIGFLIDGLYDVSHFVSKDIFLTIVY